jgi:hypothetical protein
MSVRMNYFGYHWKDFSVYNREFYLNLLTKFNFGQNRTKIKDTLQEDKNVVFFNHFGVLYAI